MIVSRIRVRWLTSARVRPARPRASARASPMPTPRLQCFTALRAAALRGAGGDDHVITAMPAAEVAQIMATPAGSFGRTGGRAGSAERLAQAGQVRRERFRRGGTVQGWAHRFERGQ